MDDPDLRSSLKDLHSASFSWAMVCCRGNRELAQEVLQSEGLTIAAAAVIMNIGVGTARQHYTRAKEKLREWLHDLKTEENQNHANSIR